MTEPLLNAKEVCALLGIKHSTWANWKKQGFASRFETVRPMGQRRYVRARVDAYLRGDETRQPLYQFGSRRRSA
jgi:predicted site-specific integrase-resolvase